MGGFSGLEGSGQGDVCGCKRSQKVEGPDRLRLQQIRKLMMMMVRDWARIAPCSCIILSKG